MEIVQDVSTLFPEWSSDQICARFLIAFLFGPLILAS